MIGNDIVDLTQARRESNWRRRGFLDKIFTPHEQQCIQQAIDPDQLVWLLWSMKESVYKLLARRTQTRTFAPRKIVCFPGESASEWVGRAVVDGETYQTRSSVTVHYIATTALAAHTGRAYQPVICRFDTTSYSDHYQRIRETIRHHSSVFFNRPLHTVHIHKDGIGAPLLTIAGAPPLPLTISHHGHYGAFAVGYKGQVLIHAKPLPA